MDTNISLYNIFYYVCEFRNITKVANFLYVSQPAITSHIRNLEKHLGKKLVIKAQKGIELTQEGLELYNQIKEPIEKLHEVDHKFMSSTSNYDITIRIIAGYSTIKKILLDALSNFNVAHTNVKYEISTYPYKEAMEKLKDGKVDLLFLNFQEFEENKNIIVKKLWSVQDAFFVSSKVKDQYPSEIKIENINDYPLITKLGPSYSKSYLDNLLNEKSQQLNPRYELSNNWLVEEYTKMGLGIGIINKDFLKTELKNKELVEIKTDYKLPKRELACAYHKDSPIYPIIKEFVSELSKDIDEK